MWADPQGQYVTHVYTRTVESRLEDDGSSSSSSSGRANDGESAEPRDLMTRVVARGATAEAVAALQLPRGMPPIGGSSGGSSSSDEAAADEYESLEVEAWSSSDYGTVIFDGGSYSLGPEYIGALNDEELAVAGGAGGSSGMDEQQAEALELLQEEEQEESSSSSALGSKSWEQVDGTLADVDSFDVPDDDAGGAVPSRTFIVEQCLCLGGDARVRLKVTLKTRTAPGQEMDVEVSRGELLLCCGNGMLVLTCAVRCPVEVGFLASDAYLVNVWQCCCLGGDARVRLKVTLKTRTARGQEMDVEVSRCDSML